MKQLLKALLAQLLAISMLVVFKTDLLHSGLSPGYLLAFQGLSAALFSWLLAQPLWWRLLHVFFLPIVVLLLVLNLPAWFYLLVFLILTLIFWGTVAGDVPLFLSSSCVAQSLTQIIADENAKNFAEIGAGIATVVVPVAKKLPNLTVLALERAPLPWLIAYFRCCKLNNVELRLKSFWHMNLHDCDVVFAFLSPAIMTQLAEKLEREMRVGSLFVSSSFPILEWRPENIIQLPDRQKTRLFCYRITQANRDHHS
jgi:hypothetical protein